MASTALGPRPYFRPAALPLVRAGRLVALALAAGLATACIPNTLVNFEPRVHVVQSGETLVSIAWRYQLDMRDLARWNQLERPDLIRVGQRLVLTPPETEDIRTAGRDPTVGAVAAGSGSAATSGSQDAGGGSAAAMPGSPDAGGGSAAAMSGPPGDSGGTAAVPGSPGAGSGTAAAPGAPDAGSGSVAASGSTAVSRAAGSAGVAAAPSVPGGGLVAGNPQAAATPDPGRPTSTPDSAAASSRPTSTPAASSRTAASLPAPAGPPRASPGGSASAPPPAPAPPPRPSPGQSSSLWQWPIRGTVVSAYGAAQSVGSGIGIGGRLGADIRAAAAGQVVYAGSGLAAYGNLVIIKHSDTFLSAYGYNRDLIVAEGDAVEQGQAIARMGMGPERQPQVHFEIRRNGMPVDPLGYLPD